MAQNCFDGTAMGDRSADMSLADTTEITGKAPAADDAPQHRTQAVDTCDLCGHSDQHVLVEATPARCRTVMCKHCGLFYAAPSLAVDLLDEFYDDEFEGDAGTKKRLDGGEIETRKIGIEDRLARKWAMPIIREHVDVAGKRVLDVRCRSGSLAEALTEAGADVTAIDPLEPNADFAQRRNSIPDVRFVAIRDLDRLTGFDDNQFDVVTALTIHTMSHMPSPRIFLDRLFDVLKPGGYLFLDEKDVLSPVRGTGASLFDSGPAHFFHFTPDTARKYLERAGLDVIECRIDPVRKKTNRHIRIVARKPAGDRTNGADLACDNQQVISAWHDAERKLRRRAGFNKFMKQTRRLLRKVWH